VTETWFKDGDALERGLEDMLDGAGYTAITLNRRPGRRGTAHGGLAVFTRSIETTAKKFKFGNPRKYEVLPTVVKMKGYPERVLVVGSYMPPPLRQRKREAAFRMSVISYMKLRDN
jgi:hypothetical protein